VDVGAAARADPVGDPPPGEEFHAQPGVALGDLGGHFQSGEPAADHGDAARGVLADASGQGPSGSQRGRVVGVFGGPGNPARPGAAAEGVHQRVVAELALLLGLPFLSCGAHPDGAPPGVHVLGPAEDQVDPGAVQ
jgi:hypothetical protein